MKTFYQFITDSVSSTRRQGIQHFQKMDPVEFVEWLRDVKKETKGILKDIKAVMKVDGLGARFGKDKNGKPFFEGSRTGPIFDSGAFTAFAKQNSNDPIALTRAAHYDDMLEIFKSASFMKAIPVNRKVVCEIFYNPMAKETKDGIQFVTVNYDKNKLGEQMSILPYTVLDAETGRECDDKNDILDKLYQLSNSKIKIINPNLKFKNIDISTFVDLATVYSDEALAVLKSRKVVDKENKQNLLNILQKIKDDLGQYILNHPGIEDKFKLGPEIEGIVLHLPIKDKNNPSVYKITTDKFKSQIANKKG